jgi:4-carboxymuconolactone decarboxylase
MARVPYVDNADGSLDGLYAEIAGLRGMVFNLHRALANQPEALRAFMVMSRYVRDDAALSPRLRELAILATAYAVDAPYEKFHHIPIARRLGVTEEQLAAFPDWAASDAFDLTDRVVLAYAEQAARSRDVEDAVFAELRQRLPLDQVVDLAVTVGWYHLCAAILGPLRIEIETAEGG